MTSYSPPSLEEREAAKASDPDSSNVNIIQEIEDVTKEHEGWYTCMAGNVQGTWGWYCLSYSYNFLEHSHPEVPTLVL